MASNSQFGSLMTERVHHTCRICRTPVVHQNQPLAYHFKSFHETTVIDYWKKYIQNSSETSIDDDSSVVMNNKKGQIPKHHPANRWVNQCEYDCRICVNSPFKAYSHGVFRSLAIVQIFILLAFFQPNVSLNQTMRHLTVPVPEATASQV